MDSYNFFDNNFSIFRPVENPKVEIPSLPSLGNLNFLSSDYYTTVTEQQNDKLPRMTDSSSQQSQSTTSSDDNKPSILNQPYSKTDEPIIDTGQFGNLDISFEDLIKQEKLPIRITSGYRGANGWRGGKTAQGRRSNHSRLDQHGHPMAYDIAPIQGKTFDDIRQAIYKNPRVVAWFKKRGWGVLEEMQDGKRGFYDIRGGFHYTGASGPHFHIGPDTYAREWYNNKIAMAANGMRFPLAPSGIPFQTFETVEEPKVEINLPLLNESLDITDWAQGITQNGDIIVKPRIPKMTDSKQPVQVQQEQQSNPTESQSVSFNGSQKEFLSTMKSLYINGIEEYNKTHNDKIDIKYADDLAAHDAVETGYGKHLSGDNNFGGIKVTKGQIDKGVPYKRKKTFEYVNGKKVYIYDNFRSFKSPEDYVKYKLEFLTSGRYAKAGVFHSSDSYASQLKRAGYYTAPVSQYESILNSVKKGLS